MRSFPSTPRHLPLRSQKRPSLTPLKPPRQRRISVSLEVDLSTAAEYGDNTGGHMYFAFLDRIPIELRQRYSTAGSTDFVTCVKLAARHNFFTS